MWILSSFNIIGIEVIVGHWTSITRDTNQVLHCKEIPSGWFHNPDCRSRLRHIPILGSNEDLVAAPSTAEIYPQFPSKVHLRTPLLRC